MIYFCADDYGLNESASARIRQCVARGALNKVSVFPNFGLPDRNGLQNILLSLHLNLVEGKCMAPAAELDLLAEKDGTFRHTFGGLFLHSVLHGKRLEAQLYQEIRAQVRFFRSLLPPGTPFGIDSHQHTHMIPAVFRALLRVLREENLEPAYLRIPAEPISPFLQTPSLWFTYRPVNLIKQWLLNFLWLINKPMLKRFPLPTADFFGILFSGQMDEPRVRKLLPKFIRRAAKTGRDIEVLFHPGYPEPDEANLNTLAFERFYRSKNRTVEFDCVMKLSERSVL